MRKLLKNNTGITLVALVVTIIILLILSGVTLGTLVGDSGLISKVIEAKEKWENAQEKENRELENYKEKIEDILNGDLGKTIDFGEGKIPIEFEGNGTEKRPYKIYKVSELAYIGMLVNHGISFEGFYFELANDLNINPNKYTIDETTNTITFSEDAKQWIPIGTESSPYKGTFNGNGHTIKGLYISNTLDSQGLFGYNSGIIRNLNIDESYIKGRYYVSAICGSNLEKGIIEQCGISKNIQIIGTECAGGIVGINQKGAFLERCYNLGKVTTTVGYAGGIVGSNYNSVKYCYNLGNITTGKNDSSNAYAGGINGYNAGTVQYTYNMGTIARTAGEAYLGGVIGQSSSGDLYDSYSSTASKVIGRNYPSAGTTTNSSIKTEAEIKSESFIDLIGGKEYWKFDTEKQLVILKWQDEKPKDYEGSNQEILGSTINFWDGKIPVPFSGEGTKSNPYKIDNVSELEYIGMLVNYGMSLEGIYVELANDLNINQNKYTIDETTNTITFSEDAKQWIPIGTENSPFKGTFNGNGHTIKGLYISNALTSQGLFGYNSGNVKGLNIAESYIKSTNYYTGGICGTNLENGLIEMCSTGKNVQIIAKHGAGGIVGINQTGGVIERCYNIGKITTTGVYAGGIAGYNYNSIKYCYNLGNITSGKNDSSNAYAGGISGYNAGTVQYTYNIGTIARTSGEAYLGGIIGQSSSGKLYDSYSLTASRVIGRNYPSAGTTTNSSIKTEADIKNESFIELIGGEEYWKFDEEKQLVILKWQ